MLGMDSIPYFYGKEKLVKHKVNGGQKFYNELYKGMSRSLLRCYGTVVVNDSLNKNMHCYFMSN